MDSPVNQKSGEQAAGDTDDELEALLDSALGDFDKPLPKTPSSESSKDDAKKETSCSEEPGTNVGESAAWSKQFQQFQDTMKAFFDQNPQLTKELEETAKSAAGDAAPSNVDADEFINSLSDTLRELAQSTQNMIPNPSTNELSHFLADFGMPSETVRAMGGGDTDQLPDVMPFVQSVMQNLLSKELLYPALKDIVKKYPDWLAEKKDSLDKKQLDRYMLQHRLMKDVCWHFDNMPSSTTEQKQALFESVFGLMQKIQECGEPPKELIGEMAMDLPLDAEGNIKLPGMSDQCSVM